MPPSFARAAAAPTDDNHPVFVTAFRSFAAAIALALQPPSPSPPSSTTAAAVTAGLENLVLAGALSLVCENTGSSNNFSRNSSTTASNGELHDEEMISAHKPVLVGWSPQREGILTSPLEDPVLALAVSTSERMERLRSLGIDPTAPVWTEDIHLNAGRSGCDICILVPNVHRVEAHCLPSGLASLPMHPSTFTGLICFRLYQRFALSEPAIILLQNLGTFLAAAVSAINVPFVSQSSVESDVQPISSSMPRSISLFMAETVHELRNPLAGIIGLGDALISQSRSLSQDQLELACSVRRIAGNMNTIVNDLLNYSRIEFTAVEESPTSCVTVVEIIEDVLDTVSPMLFNKNVEISYNLGSDIPSEVTCDIKSIRQILINVVGNAAKFTMSGEVCLTVLRQGGSFLRFDIEDTGPGIPENDRAHFFQPFAPTADVNKSMNKGSGLGLYVSHKLVNRLKGSIRMISGQVVGSKFEILLPVRFSASGLDADQTNVISPQLQDRLRESRFVIVCPAPRASRSLQSLLARMGITWAAVSNDGNLETDHRETHIICSFADPRNRASFFECLLSKPVNFSSLAAIVNSTEMEGLAFSDYWKRLERRAEGRARLIGRPLKFAKLMETVDAFARHSVVIYPPDHSNLSPRAKGLLESPSSRYSSARVLIVDDDAITRRLLVRFLEREGCSVFAASNGIDALRVFEVREDTAQRFDLVITDMRMPDFTGDQLIESIRLKNQTVPCVILSAGDVEGLRAEWISLNVNYCVMKPVDQLKVASMLERIFPPSIA
ncbi:hypothetical protein DFJ73DRAFT_90095 [Zopfochytrium polystomum]|nr:hypothetical protein DFJ73DRAFT_90095 [Zopfochytrium polystomum]